MFLTFWLANVLGATAACHFSAIFRHPRIKKWARDRPVFNILTLKCASRHSGVQFLESWTSKSAPKLKCFAHFDFEMCFPPQRHAISRRWELPKVLADRQFFSILTCKSASRHSRVQFFDILISKIAPRMPVFQHFGLENVLRAAACHFSCLLRPGAPAPAALASLLFDPADTEIIEKTQRFVSFLAFCAGGSSFYWFSRNCIFFLLTLLLFSAFHLLTLLLGSAFQLSILSEVRLLNFLWSCVMSTCDISTWFLSCTIARGVRDGEDPYMNRTRLVDCSKGELHILGPVSSEGRTCISGWAPFPGRFSRAIYICLTRIVFRDGYLWVSSDKRLWLSGDWVGTVDRGVQLASQPVTATGGQYRLRWCSLISSPAV